MIVTVSIIAGFTHVRLVFRALIASAVNNTDANFYHLDHNLNLLQDPK